MDVDFLEGIKWYLVFLLSTVCHEAAHAWAAFRLGDDTAERGGQVSLDPTPHLRREPVGMVVVPWISFLLGGWMIGWASAPYSQAWAERNPRSAALMALAGPIANMLLVVLAFLLIRFGFEWGFFRAPQGFGFLKIVSTTGPQEGMGAFCAKMVSLLFSLNLMLAFFNLLPLPPLDGSSIPFLFLPEDWAARYRSVLAHPAAGLFGLVLAWNGFGHVFPSIFQWGVKLLYSLMPVQ